MADKIGAQEDGGCGKQEAAADQSAHRQAQCGDSPTTWSAHWFAKNAYVSLNAGITYGQGGANHMRMNVATSRKTLKAALDSIAAATEEAGVTPATIRKRKRPGSKDPGLLFSTGSTRPSDGGRRDVRAATAEAVAAPAAVVMEIAPAGAATPMGVAPAAVPMAAPPAKAFATIPGAVSARFQPFQVCQPPRYQK